MFDWTLNKLHARQFIATICLATVMFSAFIARADNQSSVAADKPVAWWSFDRPDHRADGVATAGIKSPKAGLEGRPVGNVIFGTAGPRVPHFPDFAKSNDAMKIGTAGARVIVRDPGEKSVLDFDAGDTITIEAWVNLATAVAEGQQVYVVGKGRTLNKGFVDPNNQNYALRLRGVNGSTGISFLFRSRKHVDNGNTVEPNWHRWTSQPGVAPRSGWHHIAVTYTFGKGDSIRGYIDGKAVTGVWDMGGKTNAPPVVDNDELWIGSSMGGSEGSSFRGMIDELAIYRRALDAKRIASRYKYTGPKVVVPKHELLTAKDLPTGKVRVDILEHIGDQRTWNGMSGTMTDGFQTNAFGFSDLPTKYDSKGLIADRSNPFLVRASAKVTLPAGDYRILLRARNAAQLFVDGKRITATPFKNRNGSAHEKVPELAAVSEPGLLPISAGDFEAYVKLKLDAGEHVFQLESVAGGKGLRSELGELVVAIGRGDEPMRLLSPSNSADAAIAFNERSWNEYVENEYAILQELNASNRASKGREEAKYWDRRHEIARRVVGESKQPNAPTPTSLPAANWVDHYLNEKIANRNVSPAKVSDDYTFIRRLYLDTVGLVPTHIEVQAFVADARPDKRARLIDKMLSDPRWADHWVGYWQDVLAENPGILKPKLNNTGPFRWWIYESFRDNKPIDRFATELVMMEGSRYGGGPAGFAMATQNDLPMAAKAHVIGQAFLGVEMKCARCHDAPHHPFLQRDLFNVAAMLDRKSIKVPKTSVVPVSAEEAKQLIIDITLKPGEVIKPDWPFEELAPAKVPDGVIRNTKDTREQFAAILTSPHNKRFAQVVVNRLWKRLMGHGIVDPADDWSTAEPSHPELLEALGNELVSNGYDLKHVARLLLNSKAYQREVGAASDAAPKPQDRLFASQVRRRMTAEQLVDSMLAVAGKDFRSEQLTFDPEGRLAIETFLNLRSPRRAWYFTSMSNERDRPALALPMAQGYVDVLMQFGWRDTRQNPVTARDQTPTVLQPLVIANGMVGNRVTKLSDDSAFTAIALRDVDVDTIVSNVFLQVLSRKPSDAERKIFTSLLSEGFKHRVNAEAKIVRRKTFRSAVSWSNHLNAEATRIKYEMEQAAREGDPATERLDTAWRQRMEDMVWALVNSPEFLFVP